MPLADGASRDRRPRVLHRAVTGVRAGDVHDDGRCRRIVLALRQEAAGVQRRERTRASADGGWCRTQTAADDRAFACGGVIAAEGCPAFTAVIIRESG